MFNIYLYYINMKKLSLFLLILSLSLPYFCLTQRNIVTDIFIVKYSETYEQPLFMYYSVKCPQNGVSRSGLDFKLYDGVNTSDDEDYKNNVWDKGHLAPAASFDCDKEMLKKTFTYLNCSLQHQSLNRGPWKELEEFERNLANFYDSVSVEVECHFSVNSQILPTGATVPIGFTKKIQWDGREECFYFPNNETVKGKNWIEFRIN